MKTIWKFKTNGGLVCHKEADTIVEVPKQHTFISAGLDPSGILCVWAMVETNSEMVNKKIYVRGTGHEIEEEIWELYIDSFLGSVVDREFVWHVFVDNK